MRQTITVELPPTFYWDHVMRELPAGTVVKEKRRTVLVELTPDEAAELLSDAEHYATAPAGYWDGVSLGLLASARATAKRLRAAMGDQAPGPYRAHAAALEKTFVFRNPGAGYPLTTQARARTEAEARRMVAADLACTAEWPVAEVRS